MNVSNNLGWNDAAEKPIPQVVGTPVEVQYMLGGGVIKITKGIACVPFGVYCGADEPIQCRDILRWRYISAC